MNCELGLEGVVLMINSSRPSKNNCEHKQFVSNLRFCRRIRETNLRIKLEWNRRVITFVIQFLNKENNI